MINRLVKAMDPLCSIYDVSLRTSAEKHDLGIGDDPSAKVDFVLAGPLYNEQRDRK